MNKSNHKDSNFKAVFFDFGGTLMDAESDKVAHYYMMKDLKKFYQLSATEEELVNLYHKQLFNLDMTLKDTSHNGDSNNNQFRKLYFYSKSAFQSLLKEYNLKASPSDFRLFQKIYYQNHLKYIRLVEGVWDALLLVKNNGYHCGIISDIDLDYQQKQFQALGINDAFHSITTSEEVKHYKPDPAIFKAALQKARCLGKEAIMIGDSYTKDIIGGKNMEMTTIWINNYQNHLDKNMATDKADYRISQFKEVIPILNKLL
jgi:HAD superfamily hydrolase (TIGR01549 family)